VVKKGRYSLLIENVVKTSPVSIDCPAILVSNLIQVDGCRMGSCVSLQT
jgi:hypothetical protein